MTEEVAVVVGRPSFNIVVKVRSNNMSKNNKLAAVSLSDLDTVAGGCGRNRGGSDWNNGNSGGDGNNMNNMMMMLMMTLLRDRDSDRRGRRRRR